MMLTTTQKALLLLGLVPAWHRGCFLSVSLSVKIRRPNEAEFACNSPAYLLATGAVMVETMLCIAHEDLRALYENAHERGLYGNGYYGRDPTLVAPEKVRS